MAERPRAAEGVPPAADVPPGAGRRGRFWLFAPFGLLVLTGAVWIGAWFLIRARTGEALDAWMAHEASAGRRWDCPDRTIAGFPFRLEIACPRLGLQRGELTASVGRVSSVAQIYRPRHIILEAEGPLRVSEGSSVAIDGTWQALRASIRAEADGLQRVSVVADAPSLRLAGLAPGPLELAAQHLEAHLRPDPARAQDGAVELVAEASRAVVPLLDELVGGREPADLNARLTLTQARDAPVRPIPEEVERWRNAGGRLELGGLSLTKGARRFEAKGVLSLDEMHRPAGRIELAANDLGGLLGRAPPAAAQPPAAGASALRPLPPLRLENGRVYLGPLQVPGLRLIPVY